MSPHPSQKVIGVTGVLSKWSGSEGQMVLTSEGVNHSPCPSRIPEFEFLAKQACLRTRTLRLSPTWSNAPRPPAALPRSQYAKSIPECPDPFRYGETYSECKDPFRNRRVETPRVLRYGPPLIPQSSGGQTAPAGAVTGAAGVVKAGTARAGPPGHRGRPGFYFLRGRGPICPWLSGPSLRRRFLGESARGKR
jgi:hypothetical protein